MTAVHRHARMYGKEGGYNFWPLKKGEGIGSGGRIGRVEGRVESKTSSWEVQSEEWPGNRAPTGKYFGMRLVHGRAIQAQPGVPPAPARWRGGTKSTCVQPRHCNSTCYGVLLSSWVLRTP